jgi:inosine/xanthosine triphosphatase
MIEIAVGSKNPTKLKAVERAANQLWTERSRIVGFDVPSGVVNQPMSDGAMLEGARIRASNASIRMPMADFAVGLEGGIRMMPTGWYDLGWVCAMHIETGRIEYGSTAALKVPTPVSDLMRVQGIELSEAVSRIYGTDTVTDRDCSAVLTRGRLPADTLYATGVIAAFAALNQD